MNCFSVTDCYERIVPPSTLRPTLPLGAALGTGCSIGTGPWLSPGFPVTDVAEPEGCPSFCAWSGSDPPPIGMASVKIFGASSSCSSWVHLVKSSPLMTGCSCELLFSCLSWSSRGLCRKLALSPTLWASYSACAATESFRVSAFPISCFWSS